MLRVTGIADSRAAARAASAGGGWGHPPEQRGTCGFACTMRSSWSSSTPTGALGKPGGRIMAIAFDTPKESQARFDFRDGIDSCSRVGQASPHTHPTTPQATASTVRYAKSPGTDWKGLLGASQMHCRSEVRCTAEAAVNSFFFFNYKNEAFELRGLASRARPSSARVAPF